MWYDNGAEYTKLMLEKAKNDEAKAKQIKRSKTFKNNLNVKAVSNVRDAIVDKTEAAEKKLNKFLKRKKTLRKSLLSEALFLMVKDSSPSCIVNNRTDAIKRNLVDNFIEEHGEINLLGQFRTKSYVLSEMASTINKYYDYIVEKSEKTTEDEEDLLSVYLDSEMKENFHADIKTDDFNEVNEMIKMRVSQAIEDFTITNSADKHAITQIMKTSEEKINSTHDEDIQESYRHMYGERISKVRDRRDKSIYETMVYNTSKNILRDEKMRETFVTENGIDMDSIMETSEILYTFLECMNTAKLCKITPESISKILNIK